MKEEEADNCEVDESGRDLKEGKRAAESQQAR